MVIDRICKPMVGMARTRLKIPNEDCIIPPPVLGFADNIALSAYDVNVLKDMISEPVMLKSG